jgi:hypothetical protein
MEQNTIQINGESYTKTSTIQNTAIAEKTNGMSYVVVRTYSAGVHIGYLKSRKGKEVELVNSRRLYSWSGANSLSQVAIDGVGKDSRLAMILPLIVLTEAIEIIPTSQKAKSAIEAIAIWKQ